MPVKVNASIASLDALSQASIRMHGMQGKDWVETQKRTASAVLALGKRRWSYSALASSSSFFGASPGFTTSIIALEIRSVISGFSFRKVLAASRP